ncbi:MAG TPA: asparagine synthase-related protein [Rhizomicrobium sp.]
MIESRPPAEERRWRLETEDFAADWRGFLFVRGHMAGEDSVRRLWREFRARGPEQALSLGRGSFSLTLLDKQTGSTFACTDAFGLVQLFVAEDRIGDDLIRTVRQLPGDDTALDRGGLAAFMRYGSYILGRTVDRRVRVLGGGEIVKWTADSGLQFLRKVSADRHGFEFDAYVTDLKTAAAGERISLDLTGGIDSRLLAAAFSHAHIPVEDCATMGTGAQKDMPIARQVAAELKLPHRPAQYAEANFESRLPELLEVTNGLVGLVTYDHAFQFARERQQRGITLGVSGVGGELWKDFWWLQDFPFLSGRPRFEWLHATRVEPRPPDKSRLTPALANTFEASRQEYLAAMSRYSALPKTQAYDSVYAFLRVPFVTGPWVSATLRAGLSTLCPLLDIDGVRAAMHMRRRERLFAAWHRANIARLAPQIAPLPTADGTSARPGAAAFADLPLYVADKAARLAQKVAQRLGARDLIRRSLFDPRAFRTEAVHEQARGALATLARAGAVQPNIEAAALPFPLFERVLTAGLLLQELY